MESYYLDWANLLLRWVHVITAIAWIGASFYFVMLDNSLEKPPDQESLDKGVSGEQWAVHGGGFYNMQKYALAPKKLPDHLHWSYWESYSTWLTGFALFTMSYLWNASTYLIDKSKMDWQPGAAIGVALAFFVVFWMVYDGICQIFGQRKNGDTIVGVLMPLFIAFAAWLACHWFAGPRGLPAGRRDDGHDHERQRVLLDHPRPAQERGGAAQGRPAGRPDPRPARQAAQRAQHLLHAAGAVRDAEQPLQLHLHATSTTGSCCC